MLLLKTAALLIFLTGIAHSWLGERYLLMRLFRRDNLPKLFGGTAFTIGTLRFAWHLTSIAWAGFAALLWMASDGPLDRAGVLQVITLTCGVSALFPLVFTSGRHLSWLVFLAVTGLIVLAR